MSNCVVRAFDKQSSETGGAARITVEHSSESDRGGPRHTRITIHRVGGGTNPFQEYDSFVVFCFLRNGFFCTFLIF